LYFHRELASFERFLVQIFLECLEAPLLHWQASFPISKGMIDLVFVKVIALATYLGSWGCVAPIIVSRFL
jgi:hypothetical protein